MQQPTASTHLRIKATGTDKRARTRATLLEAAFQVIGNERGRFARIEQVAQAAGVARPTLYTYFSSMESLLNALSENLTEAFNTALQAHCARGMNHAEDAAIAVRGYLHKAAGSPTWGWGMVNISLCGPVFGIRTYAAATATIAGGLADGTFKDVSLEIGRDILMGTTLAAMTTVLHENVPSDHPEQVAQQILLALGVERRRAAALAHLPLPRFILDDSRPGPAVSQLLPA